MKNVLKALLLVSISFNSIAAMSTAEYFHQADRKQILVEGGYDFVNTDTDNDGSESETSRTAINVTAEYGINDMFSTGLSLRQNYEDGNSGLSNYVLYGKMRLQKFRLKFNLSISPEKAETDTFVSGASYYELEFGYEITKEMGARFIITPEYDYKFKGFSNTYTRGVATATSFYYEYKHDFALLGGEFAYLTYAASELDGETQGKDSNYAQFRFYSNKELYGIELIPSFVYANYLGEDSDIDQTEAKLELHIRKRF